MTESFDDVMNEIADKIGVYGSCKAEGIENDDCAGCENENPLCCRVGFMMEYQGRILKAIENDVKLSK